MLVRYDFFGGWNFWLLSLSYIFYTSRIYGKVSTCENGLCDPGTGNLLIGRENKLSASSTCGFHEKERYCIVLHTQSDKENKTSASKELKKKCFWCDSTLKFAKTELSHRIENIVTNTNSGIRKKSNQHLWWQSQNGVENVTIRLDLETEFIFTYLFIKFGTFRPAAMLVERSRDYGQTWEVYRYFAHDCSSIFPNVPNETEYLAQRDKYNLSTPYCDFKYSHIEPLKDGELVLKFLTSDLDPASQEVQNLVKMTNLRINFTKLHTLGDDLLDNRAEIQDKYYYAIKEMVVGGSCSCHGHADTCVPQEGVEPKPYMVHGQCACAHNTKGLNCEKCEDYFNDLEWAPAVRNQPNACKRCDCNSHASSCHFDKTIFEQTGRISGGVCDDCQHNTMGRNCEQCKHMFYQDPLRDFTDPDVCIPCDCDPAGSLDSGICDSRTDSANDLESGRCHCKTYVDGRRCDTCKNGFWNFTESNPDGCQACSCNTFGTYDNQGCNKDTGECTCKRYVTGRDCNECLPQFWGLSEISNGCEPCDCDMGGSLDNNCDFISGQCRCRPNISGRRCNTSDQSFYTGTLDYIIKEGELAQCHGVCQVDVREPYADGPTTWTGEGFVRAFPGTVLEFSIDNLPKSMDYDIVIRYEPQMPVDWERVRVSVQRLNETDPNGPCAKGLLQDDIKEVSLPRGDTKVVVKPSTCLEAGKQYKVRLEFLRTPGISEQPSASILIDSLLIGPRIESIPFIHDLDTGPDKLTEFEDNDCAETGYSINQDDVPEACKKYYFSIGAYIHGGAFPCLCDSTGAISSICDPLGGKCECKPNVVGRKCDRCAPGTYGFGPEGCKPCDCHSVGALNNFCDLYSGQCKCQPQTYGRVCDQCQPGYWNYPNCERCICHGHADTCDSRTGVCIGCGNFTHGHHCDRCMEGFYGDPRLEVGIPCRMCSCPDTIESGHSFAKHCSLDMTTQDVICECEQGYAGAKCDMCSDNYFGNPEVNGGQCSLCNCSNNIDVTRPGNCDAHTGKCLQCLFNSEGFNCQYCKVGFYGDAIQQLCSECKCSILGTDKKRGACDRATGQCPCLPNVTGLNCDHCVENHWKIATGTGCEDCACDPIGSVSEQCNEFDGQCTCKPGFGGRQCDQCQANFWGNPNVECYPCNCNPDGSATMQCNRDNGTCVCMMGMGGDKCDQCARGYLGDAPNCDACGECFDNWDLTLNALQDQSNQVIASATEIMKTGVTGSYTKEFENMENKLLDIKRILQNTTASRQQLDSLDKAIQEYRATLTPSELLNNVTQQVENVTQRITLQLLMLSDLKSKANSLNNTAYILKDNATKLQEGNVEGALNLTQEAWARSSKVKLKNEETDNIIGNVERQCKRTEHLVGKQSNSFEQGLRDNDKLLQKLNENVNELEMQIPNLNLQVCDKGGNPCDQLCGGAGCGFCGGISCENGALTKSENALKFSKDAEKHIHDKLTKAGELNRAINQAKAEARTALEAANMTHQSSLAAANKTASVFNATFRRTLELEDFLSSPKVTPDEIRQLASDALSKNIKLQPEQITVLAKRISDTISSLSNIPAIIQETAADLKKAQDIKKQADDAKSSADNILGVAEEVAKTLNEAEEFQKQAELAVETANDNIANAQQNLTKVSAEVIAARDQVNDTLTLVSNIQDKMKQVQTEYLKNDASDIVDKINLLKKDVDATQSKTQNLTMSYQNTVKQLDDHSKNSTEAREKAQAILEKATQLAANTNSKLNELSDSQITFEDHAKQLNTISEEVSELLKKMEQNYQNISQKSAYYINCNP